MRPTPRFFSAMALALAAACLAGCISVFPKEKPAQVYRFGQTLAPVAAPAAAAGMSFTVARGNIDFAPAAAGERMLTVTGNETAYIAGVRWVSSAAALFDAAVGQAFEGGPARLIARGEPTRADYSLTLDVRTFEARYSDPSAAPTVRVEVYAALGKTAERTDRSRIFVGEAAASDNRVGAIVAAYDAALGKVLAQIVPWVDAKGEG